jgi:protein gp37
MAATIISWTNQTWNPTTGCSKVSEGCRNCYAERLSLRFGRSKKPWTAPNARENVQLHPERLRKPYSWKQPSMVFVNSMSDLFHELIPDDFVAQVFAVMNECEQHTFQILTKRPERAAVWPGPWTRNIWMGTSVEDQRAADQRIPLLTQCGAGTRFLSCEPLLAPVNLAPWLSELDWVIVGGESGPGFRPMDHAWARSIRDQCVAAGVAFFFKQSAAFQTERGTALDELDGSRMTWQQYPGHLDPPVRIAP